MKRIKSESTILPSPHTPGVGLNAVGARRERVEVNMWRTLAPYARRAGYRTQRDLAKALGLTREHINRVCRGQVYFTEDLEHRLTFLLGLTAIECNAAFGFPGMKPTTITDISLKGAVDGGVLARAASGLRVVGSGRPARKA